MYIYPIKNYIVNELSFTGGARIGRANATKPFAKLIVNKDRLEINPRY